MNAANKLMFIQGDTICFMVWITCRNVYLKKQEDLFREKEKYYFYIRLWECVDLHKNKSHQTEDKGDILAIPYKLGFLSAG